VSSDSSVAKTILLVLGGLFLVGLGLVAALALWIHAETTGIEGPDDGYGGVVVYEDSDYTPPPEPTP
jgi:hypothetical protein